MAAVPKVTKAYTSRTVSYLFTSTHDLYFICYINAGLVPGPSGNLVPAFRGSPPPGGSEGLGDPIFRPGPGRELNQLSKIGPRHFQEGAGGFREALQEIFGDVLGSKMETFWCQFCII